MSVRVCVWLLLAAGARVARCESVMPPPAPPASAPETAPRTPATTGSFFAQPATPETPASTTPTQPQANALSPWSLYAPAALVTPQAQIPLQAYDRYRPLPPLTTRQPGNMPPSRETPGLQCKNLTIHPTIISTLMYDDNVMSGPRAVAHADFLAENLGGFELSWLPTDEFSITSNFAYGWHQYMTTFVPSYPTVDAGVALNWGRFGIDGLTVSVMEQYRQTGDVGKQDLYFRSPIPFSIENSFDRLLRAQGNTVGPNVSYEFNRWTLGASYQYGLIDYLDARNSSRNETNHVFNSVFSYNASDVVSFYANYNFQRRIPVERPEEQSDRHVFGVGATGTVGKFTYDVAIGYDRAKILAAAAGSSEYRLVGRAGYEFMKSLTFVADTGYSLGEDVNGTRFERYDVSGSARVTFLDKVTAEPGVTFTEAKTPGDRQTEVGLRMRAGCRLFKFVDGFVSYDYVLRQGTGVPDIPNNRVQIGLSAKF